MESTKDQMYVTVHGSNRVELVGKLRAAADNLDGTPASVTGKVTKSSTARPAAKAAAAVSEEEDDDFKADDSGEPNGFDDSGMDDAGEEDEPPVKAKATAGKGKAKKITLDDVNDACKAHAQANGRPATLGLLKKKFKTESVTALKPEQYEACISAMAVN